MDWVLANWEWIMLGFYTLEKDMIQWVDAITEERKKNPFNMKVANALANGEVEMSIKKNTQ